MTGRAALGAGRGERVGGCLSSGEKSERQSFVRTSLGDRSVRKNVSHASLNQKCHV